MHTLFLTGGAGFIGSEVTRRFLNAGFRVAIYDNFCRGKRTFLPQAKELFVIEGDIRSQRDLKNAIAETKPDILCHLAALHFIPDCLASPMEAMEVNVEGTRNVFESCGGQGLSKVIFASTAGVYAPQEHPHSEEDSPVGPLEIYGESKLLGEQLAEDFSRRTLTPTIVLRLFNAVGPRETNAHVIPHICDSLRKADRIPLGNIRPRRDYVHTRDIADAIFAAALSSINRFTVINIGTGSAYSVAEIVSRLRLLLRRPVEIEVEDGRVRNTERMVLLADTRKAAELLNWRASITMDESLQDLVDYYGLQKVSDTDYLSQIRR